MKRVKKVKKEFNIEYLKNLIFNLIKKYEKEIKAVWIIKVEKEILLFTLLNDFAPKKKIKEFQIATAKLKLPKNLKIYSYMLSEYFSNIMQNREEVFAEIKRAQVLYDPSGVIGPIKILIEEGKIKKTKEAMIQSIISIGDQKKEINSIKQNILSSIYSAVIDASQGPLHLKGMTNMIPSQIPTQLEQFIKEKEITYRDIEIFKEIYEIYKAYEHGEIKDIPGKKLDQLIKKAEKFIDNMQCLAFGMMKD